MLYHVFLFECFFEPNNSNAVYLSHQSQIRNLFLAPDAFQMRDAALHGVERDFGA